MNITAKVDYAVRAMVEIARHGDGLSRAETLSAEQDIPIGFLRTILGELRRANLLTSHQGAAGGFELARPAGQISIADVIRAVEGPLAQVRGLPPDELDYNGTAQPLQRVWVAVRANLRAVLDHTTIEDVAMDRLPRAVTGPASSAGAWQVIERP